MGLMRLDEWARALRPDIDDATLRCARLGFAWICLGDKAASFDDLAARYLALVAAGQCDVLFDGFGRVAACVSFARLDPYAEQAVLRHGFAHLPVAALCKGERPWIVDFVAFNGHVAGALDALRRAILPQADSVTYFRYKHGRRIAKMVGRAELAGRLRHVGAPPDAAAAVAAYPNFAHGARGMLHMAIMLGKCMTLAQVCGGFAGLNPNEVQHRLWTPISLGQYRFHEDADGTAAGLATWALLDDDALARQPAPHALPPEAWNAGTVRAMTDILAAPQHRAAIEADYAGVRRYRQEEAA